MTREDRMREYARRFIRRTGANTQYAPQTGYDVPRVIGMRFVDEILKNALFVFRLCTSVSVHHRDFANDFPPLRNVANRTNR